MDKGFFLVRNKAVDLFRALTMTVMIFVNDMGRAFDVPHWLEHGDWGEDFMGLADFVFPCFLVAVGMSIPFAIENRYSKGKSAESTLLHILLRTVALIVMGVVLVNSEGGYSETGVFTAVTYRPLAIAAFFMIWNVYPKSWNGKWYKTALQCLGAVTLVWMAFAFVDAQGNHFAARWWGILGLIGWSYVFCAIAYMLARQSTYGVFMVWLSLFIIAIFTSPLNEAWGGEAIVPMKDNFLGTLLHDTLHIDNGAHHLLVMSGACLSTLAAKWNSLSVSCKLKREVCLFASMIVLALVCHIFWIFNKLTPTLPWVFMAVAAAVGCYALFSHQAESSALKMLYKVLKPAGTATLTVYMIPSLLYVLFQLFEIQWPEWSREGIVGVMNCVCFVAVTIALGALFEKLKLKLKV